MRPEDRVSVDRPAARAAKGRVLPPPPRYREALLKSIAAPEAMLPQVRKTPEINRAGNTGSIFFDNTE
jgi:hypothetical protein